MKNINFTMIKDIVISFIIPALIIFFFFLLKKVIIFFDMNSDIAIQIINILGTISAIAFYVIFLIFSIRRHIALTKLDLTKTEIISNNEINLLLKNNNQKSSENITNITNNIFTSEEYYIQESNLNSLTQDLLKFYMFYVYDVCNKLNLKHDNIYVSEEKMAQSIAYFKIEMVQYLRDFKVKKIPKHIISGSITYWFIKFKPIITDDKNDLNELVAYTFPLKAFKGNRTFDISQQFHKTLLNTLSTRSFTSYMLSIIYFLIYEKQGVIHEKTK